MRPLREDVMVFALSILLFMAMVRAIYMAALGMWKSNSHDPSLIWMLEVCIRAGLALATIALFLIGLPGTLWALLGLLIFCIFVSYMILCFAWEIIARRHRT